MLGLNWLRTRGMPAECFISHRYADDKLRALLEHMPRHVRPIIFPQIEVPPDQRVSDDLVAALQRCPGLVYLDTDISMSSPWVRFERDYALRSHLRVYSYDPARYVFKRDKAAPLPLDVFPFFASEDGSQVNEIIRFLAEKRSFDVFDDVLEIGADFAARREEALAGRLAGGGYAVVFLSRYIFRNEYRTRQIDFALSRWPRKILPVVLPGLPARKLDLPIKLTALGNVILYKEEDEYGPEDPSRLDWRRVDDLMVRIFYLVFRDKQTGEQQR